MRPLVETWLKKSPELQAALARWNQEPIPWLRMPPPGSGVKIKVPVFGPKNRLTHFEVKLRKVYGRWVLSDPMLLLTMAKPLDIVHDTLLKQIQEAEKTFGYMAHPRNYYLLDSFEVGMMDSPWDDTTKLFWKCYWVVMPKSWRKKLWKAGRQ